MSEIFQLTPPRRNNGKRERERDPPRSFSRGVEMSPPLSILNNSGTQPQTAEMALGYPSHDNMTRTHKLFAEVAREPLSLLSADFGISAERSAVL